MRQHKIKVSKEALDLVENLLWVFGDIPNIKSSTSDKSILIFNSKEDLQLELEVDE